MTKSSSDSSSHLLSLGITILLVLSVSLKVSAAQSEIAGQVGQVQTLGAGSGAPGGLDFRVYLVGNPIICNGNTWAYVNVTDPNYSTLVANVFLAKSLGLTLDLWVTVVGAYCQIDAIYLN